MTAITHASLGNLILSPKGKIDSSIQLNEYLALKSTLTKSGQWVYKGRDATVAVDQRRAGEIMNKVRLQETILNQVRLKLKNGKRLDPTTSSYRYFARHEPSFLALLGSPTFDGSWFYGDLHSRTAHIISASLVKSFVDISLIHVSMLHEMLIQYREHCVALPALDAGSNGTSLGDSAIVGNSSVAGSSSALVNKPTVPSAIKSGSISVASDINIRFWPSLACEPTGFKPCSTPEDDFLFALSNTRVGFQSFFNDLNVIGKAGINDDVISLSCFDESLYCALVREMHRFSLAEIADNKAELANKNAGLGAMVGSLLGLISGNMFAPFLGHSYGKNISDRGKKVEEFLPDPNLLFYQDENSYLSWSKAQVTSPRLRRLIFDRRVRADGNIFFRLIPAIVTADSVFPVQLFKIDSSTYFYRPFSAGIERNQPHYDSVKIQRRYFHLRGEGVVSETDMKVFVSGRDVEEYESKIFRFQGSSLDYFYLDFKTSPGSVF